MKKFLAKYNIEIKLILFVLAMSGIYFYSVYCTNTPQDTITPVKYVPAGDPNWWMWLM